jgi:hypothetical protein
MRRELVYSSKLEKKFDPMDPKTLAIEAKLSSLDVTEEGRIQGVVPAGANKSLPVNSAFKRVENYNFIIAPEPSGVIFIAGEKS